MTGLNGKVALITGSARGMGKAIALRYAELGANVVFAINSKGTLFTLRKAARYVADNGRIIYVSSSTTCNPIPGVGLYGSSKMAARYAVGVLAQEIGGRGVTVKTILPTVIADAGVFTDIAGWVSGQHLLISGGAQQ
ncbi:SDR family NAD(P)-dependent oxidoreductase [Mycolicibacterium boenickei]|uniref:SDR family NAD(P)-dependent oxidoreductase n=1 Tax=Mycolicibacterium boenickei TaxID=146017 RepID=A0AAX3A3P2_9MYCO|nr:SDR family NAD(P)-dependent oxidoreductase [Mycolicibacterium boenickei]PEG60066.1 hypothetical protein CQY21_13250 [Mycolicibacterium boenickei]UNC01924.1 SDR family NAD(P)-dependent oxidoreductase [Mycolicibacterium boenickei]BBX91861.1 hypothetical protein MBOE_35100 [Mycolicibacterium boenickei]